MKCIQKGLILRYYVSKVLQMVTFASAELQELADAFPLN